MKNYVEVFIRRLRAAQWKGGNSLWKQRAQALAGGLEREVERGFFDSVAASTEKERLVAWIRASASAPAYCAPTWGRSFAEAVAQLIVAGLIDVDPIDVEHGKDLQQQERFREWEKGDPIRLRVADHMRMGADKVDDSDDAMYAVWLRYYLETEDYDRTICTGPIERGVIMPATWEQRQKSSAFAQKRRDQALRELSEIPGANDARSEQLRRMALNAPYISPEHRRKS